MKKIKSYGIMNCMDLDQKLAIRGGDEVDSIVLNIDYVRCDPAKGGQCQKLTLDKLKNYLDHPELVLVYN